MLPTRLSCLLTQILGSKYHDNIYPQMKNPAIYIANLMLEFPFIGHGGQDVIQNLKLFADGH